MSVTALTVGLFTDALAVTTNVTSDDTVQIGDIVYKFEATPAAAYDVDVGTDADTSRDNLIAAINADLSEAAEFYETGTLANPYVTAEAGSDDHIIDLRARVAGDQVNGLYVAASTTDVAVESATFGQGANTGQVDGAGLFPTFVNDLLTKTQLNSEVISALRTVTPAAD